MPEEQRGLLQARCILWQMWGNEAALLSSYLMVMGGAIGVAGGVLSQYPFWFPVGVYSMICGTLISIIEYPRGEKTKGRSWKRSMFYFLMIRSAVKPCHQDIFTTIVDKLSIFSKFSYRAVIYLILATPTLISIPTLLGGLGVFISCFIYIQAARKGESWVGIKVKSVKSAAPTAATTAPTAQAPTRPPPRLPTSPPFNNYNTLPQ